jgi:Phosphotransferase enzyme family
MTAAHRGPLWTGERDPVGRSLSSGKATLTWSDDGATITKTVVPGLLIPHWAPTLGTPHQAARNELRVNRMLSRYPPPVRAPRLLGWSRRGPSMTFEALEGTPLGPKFPTSLATSEVDALIMLAIALGHYRPRRRWFRRLYIGRRLALHRRSGLISPADAAALAALAARPDLKWSFAHGDITARNVVQDARGHVALIDWEWAGLYPAGYDLAFLWFSLIDLPGGRDTARAVVPGSSAAGFLLSATMVHLLHLQMALIHPNPHVANQQRSLAGLLAEVHRLSKATRSKPEVCAVVQELHGSITD